MCKCLGEDCALDKVDLSSDNHANCEAYCQHEWGTGESHDASTSPIVPESTAVFGGAALRIAAVAHGRWNAKAVTITNMGCKNANLKHYSLDYTHNVAVNLG